MTSAEALNILDGLAADHIRTLQARGDQMTGNLVQGGAAQALQVLRDAIAPKPSEDHSRA